MTSAASSTVREQILQACFDLLSKRGIGDPVVDDLVACAGVTRATFYGSVGSKQEVVRAYLDHLYLTWAEALETAVAVRGEGPDSLLGIFDAVEELGGKETDAPCASLVHVLAELGPDGPLGQAAIQLSAQLTARIARLAKAAGIHEPDEFAKDLRLLLDGSILCISEGSFRGVDDAKVLARAVIKHHLAPQEAPA
jgi:AcrR family transcriptional regulator